MPFDGLSTNLLADVARSLGITPVPLEVLEAHKKAEVAKHPVSWFYRHSVIGTIAPALLTGFLFSSIMLMFLSTILVRESLLPMLIPVCGVGLSVAGIVIYRCIMQWSGLNGPAYWVERYGFSYNDVPEEIGRMARQIRKTLPAAYPVVGELRQDQVVLDPYLVMFHGDERIVLGIWDDNGIIHQAEH